MNNENFDMEQSNLVEDEVMTEEPVKSKGDELYKDINSMFNSVKDEPKEINKNNIIVEFIKYILSLLKNSIFLTIVAITVIVICTVVLTIFDSQPATTAQDYIDILNR